MKGWTACVPIPTACARTTRKDVDWPPIYEQCQADPEDTVQCSCGRWWCQDDYQWHIDRGYCVPVPAEVA